VFAERFVYDLGIMISVATILAMFARRFNIPTIIAYIIAGLLLGPLTGVLEVDHAIEIIAEVGIVLLLFLVGLELSLDKIKDVGRVAVVAGIGQVVFTAIGGYAMAWLLGFTVIEAIFLGVALTFSSTVVVVKLLDQKGELNRLYGRIAVGIFLVQDLVVIFVLTLLAAFGLSDEGVGVAELFVNIVKAFAGTAVLLIAALFASKYLLPRPFRWAARSGETLFIWSLSWCFLFVTLSEVMGLSIEIGAFLAGISLAQLPFKDELQRRVHPLMNFFVAIFFVSLGLQMEFAGALGAWPSVVLLSLFVLIGNPLIFMIIIARFGYGERTAFYTSVTVAQISEFSFIFAAMGLTTGLINETILSLIAAIGLITIAGSSYMIIYSEPLYRFMRRFGLLKVFKAAQKEDEEPAGEEFEDHVIIVGMNAMGRALARRLCKEGHRVLAIDTDLEKLEDLPCATMMGHADDPTLLEQAGLERAKLLVSALRIEDTNKLLTYRACRAGVPVSVHGFEEQVRADLQALGADHLIVPKWAAYALQLKTFDEEDIPGSKT
jgi:Kef-type K+ transport system membrane component KefB